MSTFQSFLAPSMASDATYQAACEGIVAGMVAVGLVQTADTGQTTSWTGKAKPATTNTFDHFVILRFNDALQATNPVFIKVEFGTGSSVTLLAVRFSISSSTDGAGALNGTFVSNLQVVHPNTNSAVSIPCYFSSDGGRLQMALFSHDVGGSNSLTILVSLSRTVDSDGTPNGDGVQLISISYNVKNQQYMSNPTGPGLNPTSAVGANLMCAFPAITIHTGLGTYGPNIGFFPVLANRGYADFFDLGLLVYLKAAFPVTGQIVLLAPYGGVSHRYLSVAAWATQLACPNGNSEDPAFLLRYE